MLLRKGGEPSYDKGSRQALMELARTTAHTPQGGECPPAHSYIDDQFSLTHQRQSYNCTLVANKDAKRKGHILASYLQELFRRPKQAGKGKKKGEKRSFVAQKVALSASLHSLESQSFGRRTPE